MAHSSDKLAVSIIISQDSQFIIFKEKILVNFRRDECANYHETNYSSTKFLQLQKKKKKKTAANLSEYLEEL